MTRMSNIAGTKIQDPKVLKAVVLANSDRLAPPLDIVETREKLKAEKKAKQQAAEGRWIEFRNSVNRNI